MSVRLLNSVACGLPVGLGVHGGEIRLRVVPVNRDAALQGWQTVVLSFVVQFVQQFHADDFTVATIGSQAALAIAGSGFPARRGRH